MRHEAVFLLTATWLHDHMKRELAMAAVSMRALRPPCTRGYEMDVSTLGAGSAVWVWLSLNHSCPAGMGRWATDLREGGLRGFRDAGVKVCLVSQCPEHDLCQAGGSLAVQS